MRKLTSITTLFFLLMSVFFANAALSSQANKTDTVEKAYVATVTKSNSFISYQMIVQGKPLSFTTANKSMDVQPGQFVNAKVKEDRIVDFQNVLSVSSLHEKIMAKDTAKKTLDLELTGIVNLADTYTVHLVEGESVTTKSLADVYVGADNITVFFNAQNRVDMIVINGKTPVNTMRIGLFNAGFASLDHAKLDVKSAGGILLLDKKANQQFTIEANRLVTIMPSTGHVTATVNGSTLYTTTNRLYLLPAQEGSLLQVMSYTRAYGNPSYRGFFEVMPAATVGKLNLINEVQLENYLYQVVPSEMPASFGLEALKAQSVAARTYALSDYYSNRYANKGFHVDDSTLSQVYNNSAENALTTQAVTETKGVVMQNNGKLVDARYYSTSGGHGGNKHEVWADANGMFLGTPIPYLAAQSYAYDSVTPGQMIPLTTDEAALHAFYKNLSYKGHDSDSHYFRWKATFSKTELENTINSQIKARYTADPKFVLTQDTSGPFISKPLPAEGVGTVKNLSVTKRGAGGNMMELVVEGSTGTYKIIKEYNIRFTVRPSKTYTLSTGDMLLYRAKGGSTAYDTGYTLKNYSLLPSAFASFDIDRNQKGDITAVTFYGGGNGHGVGMSQYGASSLGAKGWGFDQILKAYYPEIALVDVYQ